MDARAQQGLEVAHGTGKVERLVAVKLRRQGGEDASPGWGDGCDGSASDKLPAKKDGRVGVPLDVRASTPIVHLPYLIVLPLPCGASVCLLPLGPLLDSQTTSP